MRPTIFEKKKFDGSNFLLIVVQHKLNVACSHQITFFCFVFTSVQKGLETTS